MGLSIGFTVTLDGTQLSMVAGPGAAGRVRSSDPCDPTPLTTSPTTNKAICNAITSHFGVCFGVDVSACRQSDGHYLTEITMRVANSSDRSKEVLDAKRAIMVATVADRLDLPSLNAAFTSG